MDYEVVPVNLIEVRQQTVIEKIFLELVGKWFDKQYLKERE